MTSTNENRRQNKASHATPTSRIVGGITRIMNHNTRLDARPR